VSSLKVEAFFDEATNTISYVAYDTATHVAAVIDPVLDYDAASGRTSRKSAGKIIAYIHAQGLQLDWILETHVHADHVSAAQYLKTQLGGRIAICAEVNKVQKVFGPIFDAEPAFTADGKQFDHLFKPDEEFKIGNLQAKAIHTPGHTPACMTYHIEDAAFVGDTLFMPDYGTARCDFPGGDAAILYSSIQRIFSLPTETRLFMCHDYKAENRDEYAWESTVEQQKAHNIHVHSGISKEKFVEMRRNRDKGLSMPALIIPSVQINMRAGHLPPKAENGTRYLKIPLDLL